MRDREERFLRGLDVVTAILLVIGGLTVGLGGIIGFEPVVTFLNSFGFLARILSVIVGLSAIYEVSMWKAIPRRWCTTVHETAHVHG
jgi:uncharacterized membrane protein YuzA (DUF378 family)